jgi:hypothetical protein
VKEARLKKTNCNDSQVTRNNDLSTRLVDDKSMSEVFSLSLEVKSQFQKLLSVL